MKYILIFILGFFVARGCQTWASYNWWELERQCRSEGIFKNRTKCIKNKKTNNLFLKIISYSSLHIIRIFDRWEIRTEG